MVGSSLLKGQYSGFTIVNIAKELSRRSHDREDSFQVNVIIQQIFQKRLEDILSASNF